MLQLNTTREWAVMMPSAGEGKQPVEIARILASDANKVMRLKFGSQYRLKDLREGFILPPAFARNLGEALVKAADLADVAWQNSSS